MLCLLFSSADAPWRCRLPPRSADAAGAALAGGFSSQPLPSPAQQQGDPAAGSLVPSVSAPAAQLDEERRRWSGGRPPLAAGPHALPQPRLTAEEVALLAALDGSQPGRSSQHLTQAAATAGAAAAQRQQRAPPPGERAALAGDGPMGVLRPRQQRLRLQPQQTLPLPDRQRGALDAPGVEQAIAAAAAAMGSRAADPSSTPSASPLGSRHLSQSMSLEHALHLAAATAMGSGSRLVHTSDEGSSLVRSSDEGSSYSGSRAASSTGRPSRASTGRQESMGRWDSSPLADADGVHAARAGGTAGRRHSSSSSIPGGRRRAAADPPAPAWLGSVWLPGVAAGWRQRCAAQRIPERGLGLPALAAFHALSGDAAA